MATVPLKANLFVIVLVLAYYLVYLASTFIISFNAMHSRAIEICRKINR